jgi:hypothetical protein
MAAENQPVFAWTQEQRVCVHILWEEHSLSTDDRASIFNKTFKDCFVVNGVNFPGSTSKALSVERSRRLHNGTYSRKAWQVVCGIVDDVQEEFMVDRLRRRVCSLLRVNNESLTPSRSTSSDSNAETTAILWDVEKFARFTESAPRKRNIAGLCTPPSTADERADDFEETPRTKRSCRAPRAQSPTVMIPKACGIQTVHTVVEAEQSPTGASSSDRSSETTRHVAATEQIRQSWDCSPSTMKMRLYHTTEWEMCPLCSRQPSTRMHRPLRHPIMISAKRTRIRACHHSFGDTGILQAREQTQPVGSRAAEAHMREHHFGDHHSAKIWNGSTYWNISTRAKTWSFAYTVRSFPPPVVYFRSYVRLCAKEIPLAVSV